MTIYCIYQTEPNFPPEDQRENAKRFSVGAYFVDASDEPAEKDVLAIVNNTKALIQSKIDEMEAKTLMNRFVREGMLAISEKTAFDLGVTQPQLYASNLGYRKIKDLDSQIAALRGQL